jgi:hypothetical protein
MWGLTSINNTNGGDCEKLSLTSVRTGCKNNEKKKKLQVVTREKTHAWRKKSHITKSYVTICTYVSRDPGILE